MNKTIYYRERTVAYRKTGLGKPVILLHGFGIDHRIWDLAVARLNDRYMLIVPDFPGSGQSDPSEDCSMEALAEAVKAIMEKENVDKAALIGHSMGGYVALAFAEKFPEAVTALGLFHSTAYGDTEERKTARDKNIAFINTHGTHEFLKQFIPALFSDGFKKVHLQTVNEIIDRYKTFQPRSLCRFLEGMKQRPDRTNVLKTFAKPVIFIIGRQDNAIPFKDSLELCHLPSLAYIHILENAGHMGMLEETEKSNQALENFLKDL